MSDGGYPAGAQYDPAAPWNEPEAKKIKVLISATYCREVEIEVPDDYTDLDIIAAAQEQAHTPGELLMDMDEDLLLSPIIEKEAASWELVDYTVDEIDYN